MESKKPLTKKDVERITKLLNGMLDEGVPLFFDYKAEHYFDDVMYGMTPIHVCSGQSIYLKVGTEDKMND